MENLDKIVDLVEVDWPSKRVLVVGDLMLDKYVWGDVERISPEAPVPVVRAAHNSEQPGGAANVAMNLAGLGASVMVIGFAGDDDDQARLKNLLELKNIEAVIVSVRDFPTISKLRILGGNQQILRLDTEGRLTPPQEAYDALLRSALDQLEEADAVILSDYAKGVLSERVCREIISAARSRKIPVIVDPKGLDFERYRGATTICPNLRELSAAVHSSMSDLEELFTAAEAMVPNLDLSYLTVTMSEKGIAVLREKSRVVAPAVARQVFDVSGAGDTVVSIIALCICCGLPIENAVQLANLGAGIVVGKVGTVPVQKFELLAALSSDIGLHASEKILPLERLLIRTAAWRSVGEKVVFTNGCFDLLHVGHITLLERARQEGDRLIVAINSDSSIRTLKGPPRPIVGERDRARVLAALGAVDAVIIFDDRTPLRLIDAVRPHVLVKGGDYTEATIVGADIIRSWGGRVKIVPTVEGFSTTKLIEKSLAMS